MHYRRLGKTGLNLSILSLGSGGANQFGQLRYVSRENIRGLVRHALDLGINYFDTASGYSQSESILGEALRGVPRDQYYLSSKIFPLREGGVIRIPELKRLVERSLSRLGVDTLDILFFHKVLPESYEETVERLMPAIHSLRAEGKIRHIGITESSKRDRQHRMLKRALQDDIFEAIMVSYGIGRCSAEQELLPLALAKDIGVVCMVAARDLLSRSAVQRLKLFQRALLSLVISPPGPSKLGLRLRETLSTLVQSAWSQEFPVAREHGPGFLELPSAGYTFAASNPAIATVLSGTTNRVHLDQNTRAAMAPALTSGEVEQLRELLKVKEPNGFQ